jgi:hypothetical protein
VHHAHRLPDLRLLQNPDDLLLRKPRLLHRPIPRSRIDVSRLPLLMNCRRVQGQRRIEVFYNRQRSKDNGVMLD